MNPKKKASSPPSLDHDNLGSAVVVAGRRLVAAHFELAPTSLGFPSDASLEVDVVTSLGLCSGTGHESAAFGTSRLSLFSPGQF